MCLYVPLLNTFRNFFFPPWDSHIVHEDSLLSASPAYPSLPAGLVDYKLDSRLSTRPRCLNDSTPTLPGGRPRVLCRVRIGFLVLRKFDDFLTVRPRVPSEDVLLYPTPHTPRSGSPTLKHETRNLPFTPPSSYPPLYFKIVVPSPFISTPQM